MKTETATAAAAVAEPAEPWLSHACQFPADQQAEIIPADMTRRHPWIGHRPHYAGWCVIPQCECECHQSQVDLGEEINLDFL